MTLGLERNNPWDLLPEHVPWFGLAAAQPDSGPLQFLEMADGIRAGVRLCYTFQSRGWNTPFLFINHFAPSPANPTAQYIQNVCDWTGYGAALGLDFHDTLTMHIWAPAIWRQEQGDAALGITSDQLNAGIAMANGAD